MKNLLWNDYTKTRCGPQDDMLVVLVQGVSLQRPDLPSSSLYTTQKRSVCVPLTFLY